MTTNSSVSSLTIDDSNGSADYPIGTPVGESGDWSTAAVYQAGAGGDFCAEVSTQADEAWTITFEPL